MIRQFDFLMSQLQNIEDVVCAEKFAKLLSENDAHFVDGVPAKESAGVLLMNMLARNKNMQFTHKEIYGIAALLSALSRLKEDDDVWGCGVISSSSSGVMYFTSEMNFLGAFVVEGRKTPAEEQGSE